MGHSSAILTANDAHHLLVIGGLGGHDQLSMVSDCWILDIDKEEWMKVSITCTYVLTYTIYTAIYMIQYLHVLLGVW